MDEKNKNNVFSTSKFHEICLTEAEVSAEEGPCSNAQPPNLALFQSRTRKIICFSIASPYNFLDSGVCWLQAIKTINVLAIFFHNNTSN